MTEYLDKWDGDIIRALRFQGEEICELAADEIERLRGEVLHLKHDISLVESMLPPGYKYEIFTVGMGLKK